MARILGVGGVFFKANDPRKLMNWYCDALGVVGQEHEQSGGFGIPLNPRALPPEAYVEWSAEARDSKHYKAEFMFNFVVDDLDGALAQVEAHGGTIESKTINLEDVGRFGWFRDPEGNQVELWQPVAQIGRTRELLDAQLSERN
jgi:predicted enzyme related to lactoylglutathione lyase